MKYTSKRLIRTDFRSFVRKAFRAKHGKILGKERYLDLLAIELGRVASGETKRLLINLPPRHLKTFLAAICLPAWVLAKDPGARIMVLTYSDDLAKRITYEIRSILRSPWYKEIFRTRVAKDRSLMDDFDTVQGGGVFATSVGGPLAGRGADLIIFDDPLDLKNANNVRLIEAVNQQFDSQILSRLNNPIDGRIVIIAHRLHEHDLSAHVSKQGNWTQVTLPLVAVRKQRYDLGDATWTRKPGELLRPGSHTKKQLEQLRQNTINPDFELFYQQGCGKARPLDIKAKHFATFDERPAAELPIILSVDPGQRGGARNSFSVIQAWAPFEGNHFLIAQWRDQCGYENLQHAYRFMKRRFRPSVALIEATANGPALIDYAKRKQFVRVVAITPDNRSKKARLVRHIRLIQGRRLHLPADASWRLDFIKEFVDFPSGTFDDQVDAAVQYLDWIADNPIPGLPPKPALGVVVGSQDLIRTRIVGTDCKPGLIQIARRRR